MQMKNVWFRLIPLCVVALLVSASFKEKSISSVGLCHGGNPWEEVARQANDPGFAMLHENPVPFHFESKAGGKAITFNTPDGKTANAFEWLASKKSDKWLLVYQEWWGLNDHIKKEAEKYFTSLKDVNVLALDMYDGKIATTREEAQKYIQEATSNMERLQAIMKGGIAHAGKNARIASIGWCFGGMLSLQSALLEGQQAVGCVMYYGPPEKDVERLKTLNCEVLGIFGTQDQGIPVASVKEFEQHMKEAGKKIEVKMYEADHAFANPSNPKYKKEYAEEAFEKSLTFLFAKFG
jgi:carboxymethylenebutenolidase